ncbi:MAG TPA: type I glyceraldehyde-3-phosphate dehydrogenase [Candidatus Paceibacterota bacterium]|nr:type I glyceraldehyde-3-phosphate dehydrogenase [Candidatus Paceibacterota bacterium]
MAKARVAINGFGRIGRTFFRMSYGHPDFEVVAVNDLGDIKSLAYLLEYDTAYGRSPYSVAVEDNALVIDGRKIAFLSEREPQNLPWGKENIDIVVESTGFFTAYDKAKAHLDAGAKRIVISAPVKTENGDAGKTVLMGVNEGELAGCAITSNASCTTNAASPLVGILNEAIGIEKAILNTVHAYTASQALVDGPSKKDFREGRAAAQNIVPSSTGAAIATTMVHGDLKGKFDGISIRVPVIVGSIVDVTFIAKRDTTVEEVNAALEKAAASETWKDVFAVTHDPLVSSDIIGAEHASIADLAFTRVVGGNLVKVLAWYDNESGYTSTLVSHVAKAAKLL